MLKVRVMGTKEDVRRFQRLLTHLPQVELLGFSDCYSNKGTVRFFRAYAEVEWNEEPAPRLRTSMNNNC